MNSFLLKFSAITFAVTAIFLVINHGCDAKRLKRYLGGKAAKPGKYSWAVSVGLKNLPVRNRCGGSILNADYVLTAAHCVDLVLPSELVIRSGSVDLRNATSTDVSSIIKHPHYQPKSGPYQRGLNDIAILKLETSLELADRMSAISLPKKDRKNVSAKFASWGVLSEEPYLATSILQVAKVKVISDEKCAKKGRPSRRPNYICVYDSTGAVLQGDSGSPLTYGKEIIGLAATSPGIIGMPSSFTNVYYYQDWIKEVIRTENDV